MVTIDPTSLVTASSAAVILLSIIIGGFQRWQSRAISSAINNLSTILMEKLETKENVAELRKEIAELRGRVMGGKP